MTQSVVSPRALLVLAALLVVAGLTTAAPPSPAVTIFAAGESLGHLEPCNCVEGMLGGFPRRLALLARLRDDRALQVSLDTGDLTGLQQTQPRLLEAKTRAALELLGRGDCWVAVGEHDLRLGVRKLRELAGAAGVTLLNANLRDPSGGPAFELKRSLVRGATRVEVVAVLDPELGDPSGTLDVLDPREAALEAFGEAAGLRVLVFHGTRERAHELLGDDMPVDAIVCGHERSRDLRPLERWGRAWVGETVRDARSLLRLELGADGADAQRLALDGHVPDDAWAQERVEAYYQEVRGLPEPPRQTIRAGGSYVGVAGCAGCHPDQAEVFRGTKHHGAQERIAALEPKKADLAECVQCHVTGYGYESGFVDLDDTSHLGEVGCESCHGVGGHHAVAPEEDKKGYGLRAGFPQSWESLCVGCHDPSNSPEFDFASYLERIRHWKPR